MAMKKNKTRLLSAAAVALWMIVPSVAQAGDRISGDWTWNVDDPDLFVAATTNSAGHLLGQFCRPESADCMYVVGFDIYCDPGDTYPVLVNSDAGAAQLEFLCSGKVGDQNVLVAADFDAIDTLVRQANRIGFALPMQGDDFKAVRFGLIGSNEALDAMLERVIQAADYVPSSRKKKDLERF